VVCTRNRADKLGAMLDAMQAIRSEHQWELLLVDNASTDGTGKVLEEAVRGMSNARVHNALTIGLGAARDAAWQVARGELVLFTDDDCYPAPDIVDQAVHLFETRPDLGFAGGRIMLHDPDDARVTIDERSEAEEIAARQFVRAGMLHGANLVFRRSVLEKTGGFDPLLGAGTLFPCEDIDAVAAAIWAGYPGRFEPSIVVRHHHGRKGHEVPRLRKSYDAGRGAYLAKYLLRKDSRNAYLKGWFANTFTNLDRKKARRLRRELVAAGKYLAKSKKPFHLLLAAPFALLVLSAAFVLALAKSVFNR